MTKARVTVVTGGHLSTCPRMLKAADALQEAGYAVRVVSVRHTAWASIADDAVRARRGWRNDVVNYERFTARRRQLATGVRYRAALAAGKALGPWRTPAALAARACGRVHDELVRLVSAEPCELVYGGTLAAMAAAAEAADRLRVPFALDLEDFHSADQESPSGDLSNGLARRIERDVLPRAAFLTAGSPMIAEAYEETYGLRPTPIHNTFTIDFGGDRARHTSEPLRVYWFSQTIGAGRGLDDVVRAFGAARIPAELHLRGRPVPSYLDGLRALRREVAPLLTMTLHGPVPPDDLIRAAQSYDAGLSCEEPTVVNHRLCLGNKIFTYLAAGVPVILSRTPAQAALAADLGSAAFPYDSGDVEGLASVFGRLAQSDAVREQARDRARAAAKRRWHWEHPLDRGALVALVRTALS